MKKILPVVFIALVTACTTVDYNEPELARNEKFIGGWVIDNKHVSVQAALEMTLYEFKSEGTIREINHYPDSVRTGQFVDWERGIFCDLDNGVWYNPDSLVLSVECNCSDSIKRRFRIEFEDDFLKGNPYEEPSNIIANNDGNWTWTINTFGWAWTKCANMDSAGAYIESLK